MEEGYIYIYQWQQQEQQEQQQQKEDSIGNSRIPIGELVDSHAAAAAAAATTTPATTVRINSRCLHPGCHYFSPQKVKDLPWSFLYFGFGLLLQFPPPIPE